MLFSLLKHYLDTDTALKVSRCLYCFTISIFHGVENYFPRLWGMGISDAIFTTPIFHGFEKYFPRLWVRASLVLILHFTKYWVYFY